MNKELKARFDEIEKKFEEIKTQMKEFEKKEEYPIYALSKNRSFIVKFKNLTDGEIIKGNQFYKIGDEQINFISHTNTRFWQILPICKERGFYHGQPVWAWDEYYKYFRDVVFYDSINKKAFYTDGESELGLSYDFYEPWEGEWLPWMLEAFKKLEL